MKLTDDGQVAFSVLGGRTNYLDQRDARHLAIRLLETAGGWSELKDAVEHLRSRLDAILYDEDAGQDVCDAFDVLTEGVTS